ncbi:MAG: HAD-IB family hydrolase [Acidobacteria bacterium]|nr:HAD-IB family hydrolase [Acidobacteriota bacterium]MCL5289004.1 HAD-IB family hydrolase [Acidobacteriota bacterium]
MNIGAFFDIDGTLVRPPSLEKRFLRYLRWRGDIGWTNFAHCAGPLLRETSRGILGSEWNGLECAAANCKTYLTGVPTAAMDAWLGWLARHPVERVPEALRRMEWHAQQGHRIFLLSGTLKPLAEAVARLMPLEVEVCATELECENGRYTGRVRGEAVCGPAKARAMERMAAEFSPDLARSYAYGDSFADRWMLMRVGHPAVVQLSGKNSWRLERLARKRGWPVLRWSAEAGVARRIQHRDTEFAEEHRENSRIPAAQVKCR